MKRPLSATLAVACISASAIIAVIDWVIREPAFDSYSVFSYCISFLFIGVITWRFLCGSRILRTLYLAFSALALIMVPFTFSLVPASDRAIYIFQGLLQLAAFILLLLPMSRIWFTRRNTAEQGAAANP